MAAAWVGLWEVGLETSQEWWNHATFAVCGLPVGSVAPPRTGWCERFVDAQDRARQRAMATEPVRTGKPYAAEHRIRRADTGE